MALAETGRTRRVRQEARRRLRDPSS
jgi:hypothetical protein